MVLVLILILIAGAGTGAGVGCVVTTGYWALAKQWALMGTGQDRANKADISISTPQAVRRRFRILFAAATSYYCRNTK